MIDPVFIVSTGRCGSTLMSSLVNMHPDLLSVSEFLVCQTSRALVGGTFDGKELFERLNVPSPGALAILDEDVKVSERLYEFGPGARYDRLNLPPILITTLPHLTDDHEALWDELGPLVRARPRARLQDHYRWLFGWLCERFGRKTWVERSGGSLLMVARLAEMFPEARFVHVYRDGRATALSMQRHDYFRLIAGGSAMLARVGIDSQQPFNLPGVSPWMPSFEKAFFSLVDARRFRHADNPIEVFGRFWSGMIERGLADLAELPADRVLAMRYEDLVAQPHVELERFARFVDPSLVDAGWIEKAAARPNAGSIGWASLQPEALASLTRACEPGLSLLGYTAHAPERDRTDAIWSLSRVRLLSDLDRGQIKALLADSTLETHPAGTRLITEGELGEDLFLIESGHVQAFRELPDGEVLVVEKLGPGDHFGETALLLGGGRRTASVRAHSDVVLRRIPHSALQAVLEGDDALEARLREMSDAQLRTAVARRSELVRALDRAPIAIRHLDLKAGEVLVRRGDPPGDAFVVVLGSLVVYDETRHPPVVVWRTSEGSCVGERSMLEGKPRAHTVVAETDTRLLVIDGGDLQALVAASPDWAAHVQALRSVYALPKMGYVTQFTGETNGAATVSTVYQLAETRRVMASRVTGRKLFTIDDVGTEVVRRVTFRQGDERRELGLDADGRVVSALVQGNWPSLGLLVRRVLERVPVTADAVERFPETGRLDAPSTRDPVLCSCLVVPEKRVRECIADGAGSIAAVQARLGCGSVCGGCHPRVAELLGEDVWTRVALTAIEELTPGCYRVELTPSEGARLPALAGQHIVVRGRVRGVWVHRSYTLTRPSHPTRYEIAVKVEPQGVFSRWLCALDPGAELEVSAPAGAAIPTGATRLVCLVAGIGVTPAIAMVREVVERGLPTRVHVHLSCSTAEQLTFGDELEAHAAAHPGISATLRVTRRDGRLHQEDIEPLVREHSDARWLLCGPSTYLRAVGRALEALGVPRDRIHVEEFTPTGDQPRASQAPVVAHRLVDEPDGGAGWEPAASVYATPRPEPGSVAGDLGQRVLGGIAWMGRTSLGGVLWRAVGGLDATYDARLPVDPTGVAGALAARFSPHALETFRVVGARYPDTGHGSAPDPYTPDGNTFVLVAPSPSVIPDAPVPPSPKLPALKLTTAIHVLRGPATVRAVLEDPETFDREGYIHHYNQQGGGAEGQPAPGHAAGGLLFGPMTGNETWRADRASLLSSVTSSWLDGQASVLPRAVEPVVRGLRARAEGGGAPFDGHTFTTRLSMRLNLALFFGIERLDEIEAAALPIWALSRKARGLITLATRGRLSAEEVRRLRAPARDALATIQAILREQVAARPGQQLSPYVRSIVDQPSDEEGIQALFPRLLTPLLAGQEAPGATWAWAIYGMARYPEVREKLLAEVDGWREVHGDEPVGLVAMNERPYTLAFLFELQRRYPAMQQVVRVAMRDGELPPDPATGVGAFSFAKGASMFTDLSAIHRCERWWSDPDRFDPERFLAGVDPGQPLAERGRTVRDLARDLEERGRFIPFGRGPGTCVGRGMSQVTSFAFVDQVLSRFTFSLADPELEIDQIEVGPPTGTLAVRVAVRPPA